MKKIILLVLCIYSSTHILFSMQNVNSLFVVDDLQKSVSPDGKSLKSCQLLLAKYALAIKSLIDACQIISEFPQSLSKLNPHVGDTCCEIRAHMITSMNLQKFSDNISQIQEYGETIWIKINNLRSDIHLKEIFSKNRKYTFSDLLNAQQIFPPEISPALKFIQNAAFLTNVKKVYFNFSDQEFTPSSLYTTEIDLAYVEKYGISVGQFKAIIKQVQKEIAQASIEYVQQELAQLHPTYLLDESIISQLKKAIEPSGPCMHTLERPTIAYFPLLVILYNRAIEKGIRLLFKFTCISEKQLTFYTTFQLYVPREGKFKPEAINAHADKNAMILEAISFPGSYDDLVTMIKQHKKILYAPAPSDEHNFKQQLLSYDILSLLCADASMHPQFAHDKGADNCVFNNKETLSDLAHYMNQAQTQATQAGVCKKNMSLFYLTHIYPDTIQNQQKQLGNTHE